MQKQLLANLLLSLFLCVFGSCDFLRSNSEPARVSEQGVDGVHFGDTKSEAERIFGPSDSGGWADGSVRSWISARYYEGPYAGLSFFVIDRDGVPSSEEPVDIFGITFPYSGKTAKNIGIGSTLMEVKEAYGMPVDSANANNNPDIFQLTYCLGERDLDFLIKSDTVSNMFLGYYEPLPPSAKQFCNN